MSAQRFKVLIPRSGKYWSQQSAESAIALYEQWRRYGFGVRLFVHCDDGDTMRVTPHQVRINAKAQGGAL